jgi:hypothetical protein
MGTRGIRERADRLRGAPLEEVLRAFGATPDPHDRARWHTPKGPLSLTPPKFMNWHLGRGGGGAIDLVMHLGDLPFLPALTWLARRFPHLESDRGPPPPSSPPAFPPLLQLPPPDGSKLARVLRYLQAERRLPAEPLDLLLEEATLYADARANAVFLLRAEDGRPVGAEIRGTTSRPFKGLAPGSRKDLGCFRTPERRASKVVICESAIDALSASTLHPGSLGLSTAGARADPPWLAPLLQGGRPVFCGFDADPAGDRAAKAMIEVHPEVQRLRPPLKDWNEVLPHRP